MRSVLYLFTPLFLAACGGGGSGSAAPAPVPPPAPPPPVSTDPAPSSRFSDASGALPASRSASCFDAHSVDVDTDGDLDLVIAGFAQSGATNLLYLNDGSGVFSDVTAANLPTNLEISEHVASGDFDMDGDVDLIIANVNDSTSTHEYYVNTGVGGVFETAPSTLPVAGLSAFVTASDFDNDNDLDLFIGNFGVSNFLVNNSFGVFTDDSAARLPGNDPEITEDSAIGDVNGDGFVDILVAYRGSASAGQGLQNRLYMNDGLGVFTDRTATNLPAQINSTFDAQFADIDGDGDLDALIGNAAIVSTSGPLLDNLWLNDGNGVFTDATTRWPQTTLSTTYGITAVDIDRDGDVDLLTAENNGSTGSGTVRAFSNDGNGNFTLATAALLGSVVGNIVDIEAADFNGDGLTDLYFCAARNFGSADSARDFLFLGQ